MMGAAWFVGVALLGLHAARRLWAEGAPLTGDLVFWLALLFASLGLIVEVWT